MHVYLVYLTCTKPFLA